MKKTSFSIYNFKTYYFMFLKCCLLLLLYTPSLLPFIFLCLFLHPFVHFVKSYLFLLVIRKKIFVVEYCIRVLWYLIVWWSSCFPFFDHHLNKNLKIASYVMPFFQFYFFDQNRFSLFPFCFLYLWLYSLISKVKKKLQQSINCRF